MSEIEDISVLTDVEESEFVEAEVEAEVETEVEAEVETEVETEVEAEVEAEFEIDTEISIPDHKVIRKVNDPSRTTDFIMSKYEFALIVSFRAQQLSMGAPTMLSSFQSMNAIEIAEEELKQGCSPIIIERKCPNNVYEYFKSSELFISDRFFTSNLMGYNIKKSPLCMA